MKENGFSTQIKNSDLVQKRRLQIATGASKLFIEKGYFKTNMRDISKATGIPIGSLYDYITKKEDILYLVFDVFHSLWTSELQASGVFEIEDPVEQLRFAVKEMLGFGNRYRDMIILMYRESKSLPKEFLKDILARESGMIKCFEEIFKKGAEKGVFEVKDPFLTANIVLFVMAVEPLRGWNLRDRYQIDYVHDYLTDFIVERVLTSSCKT